MSRCCSDPLGRRVLSPLWRNDFCVLFRKASSLPSVSASPVLCAVGRTRTLWPSDNPFSSFCKLGVRVSLRINLVATQYSDLALPPMRSQLFYIVLKNNIFDICATSLKVPAIIVSIYTAKVSANLFSLSARPPRFLAYPDGIPTDCLGSTLQWCACMLIGREMMIQLMLLVMARRLFY